jgi:hypothetical protein
MMLLVLVLALPAQAQISPSGPGAEERAIEDRQSSPYSIDEILEALRAVETGGVGGEGYDAIGDDGRAIGPFQIHRPYFADARVPGKYEDRRDLAFSRRVVIAYWKRWCPSALERCDGEVLARVHNGGPRGASKSGTLAYWLKVEGQLQTLSRKTIDARVADATRAAHR